VSGKKRGRPTQHTPELAAEICKQLAGGKTLRTVCKADDMPPESTVRQWVLDDREGFAAQYAVSREIGYQCMADELLDIADDNSRDTVADEDGHESTNHDVIARSRLRVDTRKWLLSRGDRCRRRPARPHHQPRRPLLTFTCIPASGMRSNLWRRSAYTAGPLEAANRTSCALPHCMVRRDPGAAGLSVSSRSRRSDQEPHGRPEGLPGDAGGLGGRGFCKIVEDEIRFWNGAKIYLCHCKDEKDIYKYQGAEIHVLLIDELTHWTEAMYRFLRNRVRMVGVTVPKGYEGKFPRILCGANPGNIGHLWVKTTFVTAGQPMELRLMEPSEGGMLRQYIPARLEDNPSMTEDDPGYERVLRASARRSSSRRCAGAIGT
jgi:hypothetical protein